MMLFGRYLGRHLMNRALRGRLQRPGRVQALLRLPTLLRLGYALLRDERVPVWQRGAVLALLALVFSPVDVVGNVPVIGQLWDFTMAVTVLDLFIKWAPADVVNEHITSLGLQKRVPFREK